MRARVVSDRAGSGAPAAATPPERGRANALAPDPLGPLVRDMERAVRSEIGAQSIYALLPVLVRDRELRRLLAQWREQQRQHVELLVDAIASLGGRAARHSWRRSLAAWALLAVTPVIGSRFALRLCEEAAGTCARWHAEYALHLAEHGRTEAAEACRIVSRQRLQQHWALRAWTENFSSNRPGSGGGNPGGEG